MRLWMTLCVALAVPAPGFGQSPEPEKKVEPILASMGVKYPESSREPVLVAADLLEIGEGSLPLDLQTSELTRRATVEQVGASQVQSSLAQELGMRIFAFVLRPEETLRLRMQSASGDSLWMSFLKPASGGPVAEKIKSLAQIQAKMRASRIEFTNANPEPFTLFVRVLGPARREYRIAIERSTRK